MLTLLDWRRHTIGFPYTCHYGNRCVHSIMHNDITAVNLCRLQTKHVHTLTYDFNLWLFIYCALFNYNTPGRPRTTLCL